MDEQASPLVDAYPVFELPGGGLRGFNPQLFFNPLNTLSNYALGVSSVLYTQDLHHNFGRALTVEKFNPQLICHIIQTLRVP